MPNHIVECRDTFCVESFNHQLLTYISKRVHFAEATFNMRMNLAIMDWNENVRRGCTSERLVQDMRRPDRRTPIRVLKEKSFNFAGEYGRITSSREKLTSVSL
ncbi:uncharacterized protein LOC135332660 [Halichondria panicea]|uniref:uncharacterized protein LOC135332660 n=1 Tax=Halichondria panicea TaxID=6063 RepID=UPI00312BB90D